MYNMFYNDYLQYYSFSIILVNVYSYILLITNIFLVFFLFDTNLIKSLNQFKAINNINFLSITVVLLLISIAGVPPFLGFCGKFLIFIFLFSKNNLLLLLLFLIFNLFFIYFYIQNLKFMVSKKINKVNIKNYFLSNQKIIFYINFVNFFNIVGVFYIEELIIFTNFVSINMFF